MIGRYIAIEGADGCGKTTQVRMLGVVLPGIHTAVLPSKEAYGKEVRKMLDQRHWATRNWAAMAKIFAQDRKQNHTQVVAPRVLEGVHVVTDRSMLSSLIYQGVRSREPERVVPWIRNLNGGDDFVPDLTIVLDIDPSVSAKRRVARGDEGAYEDSLTQHLVCAAYAHEAEVYAPDHTIVHVDADRSPEEVHKDILALVEAEIDA